jgi:REP element-mobilizing transposase RayT
MPSKYIPLEAGFFYHIYNHANGEDDLFKNHDNYLFFLKKYKMYLSTYVDTCAYCLMPNHFHFLIRIKEDLSEKQNKLLSNAFKKWFVSYAQSYNKVHKRKGNLFTQKFRRKNISSEKYLRNAIGYIHLNPAYHGFVNYPDDWKYSSFKAYLNDKPTQIHKNEALEFFDDRENFLFYHREQQIGYYAKLMEIEY